MSCTKIFIKRLHQVMQYFDRCMANICAVRSVRTQTLEYLSLRSAFSQTLNTFVGITSKSSLLALFPSSASSSPPRSVSSQTLNAFADILLHKFSMLTIAKLPLISLCILLSFNAQAQDLGAIGSAKPLTISGSFSSSNIFYGSLGAQSRRDPFSYFLSGSLTVSIYGWSVPLSINYSNQQTTFHQPFNQYGLSPTYKWATAHLGWRSMNFSSYTLAGHTFLGAGAELNPGKWRVGAMYGRLNKAVDYDTTQVGNLPTYERYGYGAKLGYGSATDYVDFIVFKAKDDSTSMATPPSDLNILPGENLIFGVNVAKRLFKRISFSGEWASSAYTRDVRADEVSLIAKNVYQHLGNLFTPRTSSAYHQAYKGTLQYAGNHYGLQLGYERIDPEYQTMGAYFFNNDMENITVGGNTQCFDSKVNVSAQAGVQRNNLDGNEVNQQRRLINSFNLGYSPTQAWNFSGSYSNFTTNSRRAPRLNEIVNTTDTLMLEFVQITNNTNFSTSYNGKLGEDTYAVSLNTSYQVANDRQGQQVTDRQSRFYNGNLAYSYRIATSDIGLTASLNANRNVDPDISSMALGPAVSVSQSFYEKKMRATWSSSYNRYLSEGTATGNVFNTRLNTNYNLNKNNITLSLMMLRRGGSEVNPFTEFTGTLGYSYSF